MAQPSHFGRSLLLLLLAACGPGESTAAKPRPAAAAAGARVKALVAERKAERNGDPRPDLGDAISATPEAADAAPEDESTPTDESTPDNDETHEEATSETTTDSEEPPETGEGETGETGETSPGARIADGVEFLRMELATDVVNHEPVGVGTSFPAGTRVSLFLHVRNESAQEQEVRVAWRTEATGRTSGATRVRLVKSKKGHKTRAFRTMRRPGAYTAVLMTATDDAEIATLPFTITELAE